MATTDEIREAYSQNEFGEADERYADEFDKWLRSVKAETLREAADDWHQPYDETTYEAGDWLAARADALSAVKPETPRTESFFGPSPADSLSIRGVENA